MIYGTEKIKKKKNFGATRPLTELLDITIRMEWLVPILVLV
jgi:hypothetical protein